MPILIGLDYPGRRPEAHISDLHLDRDFDCRDLLTYPLPTELDTPSYAKHLVLRSGLADGKAAAVVSYCATAPLAIAAATLAAGPDGPLPIVFLDPSQCNRRHIIGGYGSVVRQIEGQDLLPDRPQPLDVAALLANPTALVKRIDEDLRHRARLALMRDGFDEAEASGPLDHVVGTYVQWLTYLVAVHRREQPAPLRERLQVISRNHAQEAAWLNLGATRTVRINCSRTSLARQERTRDVVVDFLKRVTAP